MVEWLTDLMSQDWFYTALVMGVVAIFGYKNSAPILAWLKKTFPFLGGNDRSQQARMKAFFDVRCHLCDCDNCEEELKMFDDKIAAFALKETTDHAT